MYISVTEIIEKSIMCQVEIKNNKLFCFIAQYSSKIFDEKKYARVGLL